MFIKLTFAGLIFGALSSTLVAAYPAALEVVPGPGLPSLESLGLTSADLYTISDETACEC